MHFGSLPHQIAAQLKGARRVLVAGHTQPDADCLGSLYAYATYLEGLGCVTERYAATPPPPRLRFLPGATLISAAPVGPYDAVAILDCGDLAHAQLTRDDLRRFGSPLLINIDHHHTNLRFGHFNLVVAEASSTTEVLHHYLRQMDFAYAPPLATALLAGMVGDTGGFRYRNTSPGTLAAAADLVAAGADFSQLLELMFKDKTLPALQCWGRVLSRLRVSPRFGLATAVISRVDQAGLPNPSVDISGLANFLNGMRGVRATLVLIEQEDGTIRGSLRSHDPLLDVSKFATLMGGGGHKLAAGFTVKGRLQETKAGWRIVENS